MESEQNNSFNGNKEKSSVINGQANEVTSDVQNDTTAVSNEENRSDANEEECPVIKDEDDDFSCDEQNNSPVCDEGKIGLEEKKKIDTDIFGVNNQVLESDDLNIPGPSPFILKQRQEEFKMKEEVFLSTAAEKMMGLVYEHVKQGVSERDRGGFGLDEQRLAALTDRVCDYEQRVKTIERHLRESQREKRNLLEDIAELEKRIAGRLKRELAERIAASATPCEYDIALLDLLNSHIKDEEERSKLLQQLQTKNRALERVMNNADDMLMRSAWFRGGVFTFPKDPEKQLRFNKVGREVSFRKSEPPSEVRESSESLVTIREYSEGEESQSSLMIADELRRQEEAIPRRLSDLKEEALQLLNTAEPNNEGSSSSSSDSNI